MSAKNTPANGEGIDLAKLVELLTPAQRKALGLPNTPAKEEGEKVPFLSCWNASRINPQARTRIFAHTNRKSGEVRKYRALTPEQAHAMMDENLAAGRVYAVPVA